MSPITPIRKKSLRLLPLAFASLEHFIVRGRVQRDLSVPHDKSQSTSSSMDIELPMEIFEGSHPAIELSWIDAYR